MADELQARFELEARQRYDTFTHTFGMDYNVFQYLAPGQGESIPGWLHGLIHHYVAEEYATNAVNRPENPVSSQTVQRRLQEENHLLVSYAVVLGIAHEFIRYPADLQHAWLTVRVVLPRYDTIPVLYREIVDDRQHDPSDPETRRREEQRLRLLGHHHGPDNGGDPNITDAERQREKLRRRLGRPSGIERRARGQDDDDDDDDDAHPTTGRFRNMVRRFTSRRRGRSISRPPPLVINPPSGRSNSPDSGNDDDDVDHQNRRRTPIGRTPTTPTVRGSISGLTRRISNSIRRSASRTGRSASRTGRQQQPQSPSSPSSDDSSGQGPSDPIAGPPQPPAPASVPAPVPAPVPGPAPAWHNQLSPWVPPPQPPVGTFTEDAWAHYGPAGLTLPMFRRNAALIGIQRTLPANPTPVQIEYWKSIWQQGDHIPDVVPGHVFVCHLCGARVGPKRDMRRHFRNTHNFSTGQWIEDQELPRRARYIQNGGRVISVLVDDQGRPLPGETGRQHRPSQPGGVGS